MFRWYLGFLHLSLIWILSLILTLNVFGNDLSKHKLEDILKHKAFTEHFNEKHWNDKNNCDEICKLICSTKKEVSNG